MIPSILQAEGGGVKIEIVWGKIIASADAKGLKSIQQNSKFLSGMERE